MGTKEFNKIADGRKEEIHKLIESTLMGVLAALYESNVVKRVNMGKVVSLFGLDDSDMENTWINFDDPGFLKSYVRYKEKQNLKDQPHTVSETDSTDPDGDNFFYDDTDQTIH